MWSPTEFDSAASRAGTACALTNGTRNLPVNFTWKAEKCFSNSCRKVLSVVVMRGLSLDFAVSGRCQAGAPTEDVEKAFFTLKT